MKTAWMGATLVALLLSGNSAWAHNGDGAQGQCIADAKAEAKTCVALCRDTLRAAKDTCKGVAHDCAEAARDAREACVDTVLGAFSQCVETTCSGLQDNLDACRAQFPRFSEERWQCIRAAKVEHFQCRAGCRDTVQLGAGLRECRAEFRAAIDACPPPPVDDGGDGGGSSERRR